MKEEIDSAAEFLGKLLKMGCSKITRKQIDTFRIKMEKLLKEHFQDHWFPQKPFKGSGYRCIRINHKMDPIIAKGAESCGLRFSDLQSYFPNELTVWIDPREVSYRIGENGSICVLFDGSESSSCTESSSDSDLEITPNPVEEKNVRMTPHPPRQPSENTATMIHHNNSSNYSHPFPTPPSSPPTVQGFHNNCIRQSNVPPSNSSCRKDLNISWNSSIPITDSRSAAMFNMEQLAPYVTS